MQRCVSSGTCSTGALALILPPVSLLVEDRARSEQPDTFCYTSLISACTPSAQWQLATFLHEEMRELTDVIAFNATLGVCREASRWLEAQRIFSDLKNKDFSPTLPTFKAVIGACAYAHRWSDALDHLQELRKMACSFDDLIVQYGIVSKACAEAGRKEIEEVLLREVKIHNSSSSA
ncbi:unnamed protein product [Symbiodinium pilosum]|uniref:Pentatricopeptide repeat-containing protein, chloroplastic n=1 Tax=Symbiodinium pilosum TaxID=2952 RepID=A0A812T5H9_SYMPI|nr:unnamed protein product [Symbiodinium pilosum]